MTAFRPGPGSRSSYAHNVMIKVISLKTARDRRDLFRDMARSAELEWSFFDAHRTLACGGSNDLDKQKSVIRRVLSLGELGCYSSHLGVWDEFLNSPAETLLVLEDDVIVDWNYITMLLNGALSATGVQYLRLFNKVPVPQRRVRSPFLTQYHHLVVNLRPPLGTQAYILSRQAAGLLRGHCQRICRPIDKEMDRYWITRLPSLSIFPPPVLERYVASTIGEQRLARNTRMGRLSLPLIGDIIRRELYNAQFKLRPSIASS